MSGIALIWAQARNSAGRGVIGAGGSIPWHVPEDFAHFKQLTSGHPVVMGERTWVSLPNKPLPKRTNIVLTDKYQATPVTTPTSARHDDALPTQTGTQLDLTGATPASDLPQAFELAAGAPGGNLTWIIGGGSVYRQTIHLAQRLAVTEIDLVVDGDTYAPEISPAEFQLAASGDPEWQVSRNGLRYRFLEYVRTYQ